MTDAGTNGMIYYNIIIFIHTLLITFLILRIKSLKEIINCIKDEITFIKDITHDDHCRNLSRMNRIHSELHSKIVSLQKDGN